MTIRLKLDLLKQKPTIDGKRNLQRAAAHGGPEPEAVSPRVYFLRLQHLRLRPRLRVGYEIHRILGPLVQILTFKPKGIAPTFKPDPAWIARPVSHVY